MYIVYCKKFYQTDNRDKYEQDFCPYDEPPLAIIGFKRKNKNFIKE